MKPIESFRLGFLARCAEEGLSMDQVRDRVKFASATLVEKTAFAPGAATGAVKGLTGLLMGGTTYPWLLSSGVGAGLATLGGAGVGYGAAKMMNTDIDPEEAKQQEIIALYKRLADQARMKAQNRSYRQEVPSTPKLF